MRVYIVTLREQNPEMPSHFESGVSYIASSLKRAEKFMKANTNIQHRLYAWWWGVYTCTVDATIKNDKWLFQNFNGLKIYDWNGNRTKDDYQPIHGYEYGEDK